MAERLCLPARRPRLRLRTHSLGALGRGPRRRGACRALAGRNRRLAELLASAVSEWSAEQGLDRPIPAHALATLVANAFQGAETEILAGFSEEEAPHYEALESVAGLIEWVERRNRDDNR